MLEGSRNLRSSGRGGCQLTENDPGPEPGDGHLPEPAVIHEDGDILIDLGEATLRMAYSQFERMLEKMNAWYNHIPAVPSANL